HGLRITRPAPPHVGQVRSIRKKPCWARTLPLPWQVPQVSAERVLSSDPLPEQASHVTLVGTRKLILTPAKACTRSISTCWRRSALLRARPPPRRPPPMNSPNI